MRARHQKEAAMATVKIDTNNFEADVLGANEPVVVDFWAEWCGPCKMIAPALEELSGELDGQVKIAKVNIDENPQIAAQYGIRSIPTLYMFKGGEVVDQMIGAVPKGKLSDWMKGAIA
jgi:thioredoxin 1